MTPLLPTPLPGAQAKTVRPPQETAPAAEGSLAETFGALPLGEIGFILLVAVAFMALAWQFGDWGDGDEGGGGGGGDGGGGGGGGD